MEAHVDPYTPRKYWLILFVFTLSACNFNPGHANEPPGGGPKPSQVKVLISQVIEDEIRRVPDHWIWGHRRWRTQPQGEPKPYPSRRRRRSVTR